MVEIQTYGKSRVNLPHSMLFLGPSEGKPVHMDSETVLGLRLLLALAVIMTKLGISSLSNHTEASAEH